MVLCREVNVRKVQLSLEMTQVCPSIDIVETCYKIEKMARVIVLTKNTLQQ